MEWKDAIIRVLEDNKIPMNYEVIAREIFRKGYMEKYAPSTVSPLLNKDENRARFMSLDEGNYMLVGTPRESSALYPCDSKYKHVSDSIIFPNDISPLDKKLLYNELLYNVRLLDLIVNFRLPLVKGEVCFADIIDKLEGIEFSNKKKSRPKSVDDALIREKLKELNAKIEKLQKSNSPENQDLATLMEHVEKIKSLLDNPGKVVVLGEFVESKSKPKVVIYYKNIQDLYNIGWKDVMAGVFIHEMFHAWNYFRAGKMSRSVMVIDEPMVEFETLYFLKELKDFTDLQSHPLKDNVSIVSKKMKDMVQEKQKSTGDVAAYGFGYYLFNDMKDYDYESRHWIETYSEKSDSINIKDLSVDNAIDALIPIYPFNSEMKVMECFREIIFDGYTTSVTAGKSAAAKTGLDVSLRDLVLACIKTIGRKGFEAKELYAFAPIFEVCVAVPGNLEDALKLQLDELVKDGFLEALSHDCYCVK